MSLPKLERIRLKQVARACGFDLALEMPDGIEAWSSHSPLRAWLLRPDGKTVLLGLSSMSVAKLIDGEIVPAPVGAPPSVALWKQYPGLASLDPVLQRAWRLSVSLPNKLEERWHQRLATVSDTERESTIRQRIGQDLFREGLLALWDGRCAVTGLDLPSLLRASHAKPWAQSSDTERLDVYNGLLLAAHWDAAFDSGLVTFTDEGAAVASPLLTTAAKVVLGLAAAAPVVLQPPHLPYLQWHRDHVFMSGGA
jgi:hypothetical protein